MRNAVKILLISLSILLGGGEIWRRMTALLVPETQLFGMIAYAGLFSLCVIALIGAGFLKNGWLRWLIAAAFASAAMTIDSYQWAVGGFMDYEAFVTMVQSMGDIGNAFKQQGFVMILAFVKALLILFGIGLRPENGQAFIAKTSIATFPVLAILTAVLYFRGGDGGSGLPPGQLGTSYSILYVYEQLIDDSGPREKVAIKREQEAPLSDVILIVDESIAGAYLDINSDSGVYSGLVKDRDSFSVHNFGLAAAISHCSVGTNVMLRFGGTRENYREVTKTKPAIWAYAKAAGLDTVYIDAQRTGGTYQNRMNDAEAALIDTWHQFGDVSVIDRDHAVARKLASYLNDDEAQFILVNKVGAHFPVNDKFPDSHAKYRPMLKRGKYKDVADTSSKDNLDGRQSNWLLYRNSYRNSLLWNVGAFFDLLFAEAKIGDATIIYTSDHGQTFHERGEAGLATHCTPDPQIEEGVVPLVVIGGTEKGEFDWKGAVQTNHNKLSHYRIFPTLLSLMRYDQKSVERLYGPDLLSDVPDPFTFNIRFNARLGSDPVWKSIPLDQVVHPPRDDYRGNALARSK